MRNLVAFMCLLILGAFSACSPKNVEPPLFELLSPQLTGIDFINSLEESDSLNVFDFDYMYNGGGVAVGDFNNDGLPDIFFTGNNVSCRLYLNKGNMQFQDVTQAAGLNTNQWAEGVTLVDINQDGLLDLYVSTSRGYKKQPNANLLFVNSGLNRDGIPTFTERAAEYGIADNGYNSQAAFFDYDKDGDLDLYVVSNSVEDYNRNKPRPKQLDGRGTSTDKLYRNNGDGTFTNVSAEAGILIEGYGLGLAISDINKDGWPDIYVANDFVSNDILYINNGDGTFTNRIRDMLKHQSMNGMGTDVSDYNNDGLADIIVLDMMPDKNLRQKAMFPNINYDRHMLELSLNYEPQYIRNTLQLNNGKGPNGEISFSEIGQLAGVYKTDWSWAPLFADFDNDGFKDLFISNGYGKDVTDMDFVAYSNSLHQFGTPESKLKKIRDEMNRLIDVKVPNFIYRNKGDLTFEDKSAAWGFIQPSLSNGSAFADLDGDGDLDLIVNNVNDVAFIYQNNTNTINNGTAQTANHLKVALKGDSLNRQGLGSKITLSYSKAGKREIQYYEHYLTRGYKSTVDSKVHFGLGQVNTVDSLEIIWPDGQTEVITNVKANQVVRLDYKNSLPPAPVKNQDLKLAFRDVSNSRGLGYVHQAQDYVDFKTQLLLPHKHSEGGPGIAVGDVNGDGLEDFYVGGSAMHPGNLFVQQLDGSFSQKALAAASKLDDMGSLFFDADGDGDLDLYVVSGGSRFPAASPLYQDRLYLNDGNGNFVIKPDALPQMYSSGSVVTAADYDGDGDLDLFVGGRLMPQQYPLPAKSYILRNDSGSFKDVTKEVSPELENMGLVSAAIWSDVDGDKRVDLVLAGEWMPITVLKQEKSTAGKTRFKNITEEAGLANTSGWWNSIAAGDFDGDGDMDYIAGNLGLNSRYQASLSEPVSLYAKDYDNNGTIDPIMFYYILGENYPTHPRDALTGQLSYMRGRFDKYATYGKTSFDDFFKSDELRDAYVLKSYEFKSSFIENLGDGKFSIKPLPVQAQLAPVSGILAKDFNHDGHLDVLLVGNSYATEVLTGRYDASIGSYLEGDGKGNFKAISAGKSGFYVNGDARAIAELVNQQGQSIILISQYNDSLKAFVPAQKEALTVFKAEPTDQKADVFLKNGKKISYEFYHGASYLSQSSRILTFHQEVDSVIVFNYAGKSRTYQFPARSIATK